MDSIKLYLNDIYQSLCNLMENETVGTEVLVYGTSGVMLMTAFAKRRPKYLIRPFKRPRHIPQVLINERGVHTGTIKDIQQKGQDTLLYISRRPLIPFFTNSSRLLPIKLPGVEVNGNGFSWLQQCLVGRQATFIPLNKNTSDEYVGSQLCLVHQPNSLMDISETLLKLRFARYDKDTNDSIKKNAKYYKHLSNVATVTQRREDWLLKVSGYPWVWEKLHEFKASVLPKEKLLPELMRSH